MLDHHKKLSHVVTEAKQREPTAELRLSRMEGKTIELELSILNIRSVKKKTNLTVATMDTPCTFRGIPTVSAAKRCIPVEDEMLCDAVRVQNGMQGLYAARVVKFRDKI